MTVSSQTSSISYTGNGTTTAFSVPFHFLLASDLVVTVDDVTQTLNSHYTVSGAEDEDGGTVTFSTAPASDAAIVIRRYPPLTQLTSFSANDAFPSARNEKAFDKLTMIDQRLAADIRSLETDITKTLRSSTAVNALPDDREGRFLTFDASGNPTVSTATVAVSDAVTLASTSVVATTEIASGLLWLRTAGYGAAGDGGGGLYKRVTSQPTYGGIRSADRYLPNGSTDSTNGGWWELVDFNATPLQFGAVRANFTDATPTEDSSSAFGQWLGYIAAKGAAGKIPGGRFRADSLTTHNLASQTHFSITGSGQYATVIDVGETNADGWIAVTTSGGTATLSSIALNDLWIRPLNTSGTTCAFSFKPGGTGTSQKRSFTSYNVHIGADTAEAGYFVKCLDLTGCRRPLLVNTRTNGIYGGSQDRTAIAIDSFTAATPGVVTIAGHGFVEGVEGAYSPGAGTAPTELATYATNGTTLYVRNPTTDTFNLSDSPSGSLIAFSDVGSGSTHTFTIRDYSDTSVSYKCQYGIIVDNCYFPQIYNAVGVAMGKVISARGTVQEAGLFVDTVATNVKVGIDWYRTSQQPMLYIIRGQYQYRDRGVSIEGAREFWLENPDFRQSIAAQWNDTRPRDVYVANSTLESGCVKDAVHIQPTGDTRRVAYFLGHVISASSFTTGTPGVVNTATDHEFDDLQPVYYTNSGGSAAGGLTSGNTYFVRRINSTSFNLSSTIDGDLLEISSSGSGTHTFGPGSVGNVAIERPMFDATFHAFLYINAAAANDIAVDHPRFAATCPTPTYTVVDNSTGYTANGLAAHQVYLRDRIWLRSAATSFTFDPMTRYTAVEMTGALAAARTITLPVSTTSGTVRPWHGYRLRIVRRSTSTGAFNLNVAVDGGSTLASLTDPSTDGEQFAMVRYDYPNDTWYLESAGLVNAL